MSVLMYAPDPDGPIPRAVLITLVCEGTHEDLFGPPSVEVPVGFPVYAEATKLGWSVAADRRPGPYVLCPSCMGRV